MAVRECIISLATDWLPFGRALDRLRDSARRGGFRGEFLFWTPGNFPDGCPAHRDVPFAFKPYCFRDAQRQGMESILWLDAACVAVRSLTGIFATLQQRGHVLFRNYGKTVGEWASDAALQHFGLEREAALGLPEINAAALGLNMRNGVARNFLDLWCEAARSGVAFRGVETPIRDDADRLAIKANREQRVSSDPRVRGHRHDQTVAGILAHRLGMSIMPHGLAPYSQRDRRISRHTVIIVDRDIRNVQGELTTLDHIRRDRYIGALTGLWRRRS